MSDISFRLDGQVALVTGGNRGLGRAIAVGLARVGARVMVTSTSGSADQTLREIADAGGDGVATPLELGRGGPDRSVIDTTIEQLGGLDVLVNNAGTQHRAPVGEFPMEKWREVLEVNLTGVWALSQQAARHMTERGGGKIINVGSLLSFDGGVTVPAYTAAKHGVAGLTKAMCNELADDGVNVNAIIPGYMATAMNAALMEDEDRSRAILARIPAGRWGQPEDVVGAAVFLASAASDYVHGHLLTVDGGWRAR